LTRFPSGSILAPPDHTGDANLRSHLLAAYRAIHGRTPPGVKRTLRRGAELVLDAGRRTHYSQFGEDAFLQGYFEAKAWRADRGVRLPFSRPRIAPGFYVDVGAFSPKDLSNTYWFYRRGWRGINVDAAPGSMDAFRATRPRDVNLETAISDADGEATFYLWSTHSGTNTLSPEHVARWREQGAAPPREVRVRTRTLTSVLDEHLPPGQAVDFLSVDVEGHDLQVLRSLDWSRYRPELVLVENEVDSPELLVSSPISELLAKSGYAPHAWIPPTVVYRRCASA
jgi:FkbM family methyltransferase